MSEEHQGQDVEEPKGGEQDVLQTETKARDMGWVPQAEWKGDPDKWRDADEFVQRGEEFLPIVRSQLRKSQDRVSELEKQVAGHGDTVKRLERMGEAALKQQRKQLETEFADKKREAVKLGDEEGYAKAEKDERTALAELDKEHAEVKPEVDPKAIPPAVKAKIEAWVGENDWFNTNPRLRRHAERFYDDVEEEMPAASVEDKLAAVRERMVESYPKEFGVKPNGSSRVESGSRTPGSGSNGGGSSYSKLPAEAKAQADQFIDEGLFLQKGETAEKNRAQARERYARKYLEQP